MIHRCHVPWQAMESMTRMPGLQPGKMRGTLSCSKPFCGVTRLLKAAIVPLFLSTFLVTETLS